MARQVEIISDSGAYVCWGESTLTKACVHAAGPYRIPHVRIDGYVVYTNKPGRRRHARLRRHPARLRLRSTHGHHGGRDGLDPCEFRMKNMFVNNCSLPTGQVVETVTIAECVKRAAELGGWSGQASPLAAEVEQEVKVL